MKMFWIYYAILAAIEIAGLYEVFYSQQGFGLILAALPIFALLGLKKIPADPPHIAVPTFWGARGEGIFGEGWKLTATFFPIFLDFILVSVVLQNEDPEFKNIRCKLKEDKNTKDEDKEDPDTLKSGGSVSIIVGISYIADESRPNEYINAGSEEGVKNVLSDMLAEALRHEGTLRPWELMIFGKSLLSAILVTNLTGKLIPKAERNENDELEFGKDGKLSFEEEVSYIDPRDASEQEIQHFLSKALKNGVADIHSLGIKIRRLNVKEIQPEGKLLDDAEKPARELQQRREEEFDFETELRLANIYVEESKKSGNGNEISLEEALRMVRVNRGRAKEILVNPSKKEGGLLDNLVAAASIVSDSGKKDKEEG